MRLNDARKQEMPSVDVIRAQTLLVSPLLMHPRMCEVRFDSDEGGNK